jgi:fucose permease
MPHFLRFPYAFRDRPNLFRAGHAAPAVLLNHDPHSGDDAPESSKKQPRHGVPVAFGYDEQTMPAARYGLLLLVAYLGFISLGLPDPLVGIAWPFARDQFNLNQSALGLFFFGSAFGYIISSFLTGQLLQRLGIGMLLAGSSLLVSLSCFGYGTAPVWGLFVFSALCHGLGSGAIDGGLNHYVAHHFPARHMNWLHACYGIGAALGPYVMAGMIASTGTWRSGYFMVGGVLLCLAALFFTARSRWHTLNPSDSSPHPARTTGMWEALRQPMVILQLLLFFLYTGIEVMIGQWSFTLLTESRGFSLGSAGYCVTAFWTSLCGGRVLAGIIVPRMGTTRLLRWSMTLTAGATLVFALGVAPAISSVALIGIGCGIAAIFPGLMAETPARVGAAAAVHVIGFQVSAAMLGAAALPSLAGVLASVAGLERIPLLALVLAVLLFLLHEYVLVRSRRIARHE